MKSLYSILVLGALLPVAALAQANINPNEFPSSGLLQQNAQQGTSQDNNQSPNQNNSSLINSNQNFKNGMVPTVSVPPKSLGRKLIDDTTLTYYHQFLGPTASGRADETYNVFQAAGYGPEQKSGRAPIQSFQAANIRHQINTNWAVGASLAVSNTYSGSVVNELGGKNNRENVFYNARAYVNLPPVFTRVGILFSTLSYEAPTSVISRQDNMRYGWVLAESFAFKLPSTAWTAGVTAQAYRMVYDTNVKTSYSPVIFTDPGPLQGQVCNPSICGYNVARFNYQTFIFSGGPYVNYRFNPNWMMASSVTMDWDQKGEQTNTMKFNNNLPHRGRVAATYFPTHPMLKNLSSIGVFTQALLKFRPETTAFGAEFSLRF